MEQRPVRKPNRLPNYDYSQIGAYFVTVCVQDMRCILSRVLPDATGWDAFVDLTPIGQCVNDVLTEMAEHSPNIRIDRFVIMPNHVHLLISIVSDASGGASGRTPTNTLSRFIGTFKRFTQKSCGQKIWQRGFHDHVIRDDDDYRLRWRYIDENPRKWFMGKDAYYG
ncbi:MAG: transposase [Clostridia bacterium]|nr:transposase [Clostridia bacterium]